MRKHAAAHNAHQYARSLFSRAAHKRRNAPPHLPAPARLATTAGIVPQRMQNIRMAHRLV